MIFFKDYLHVRNQECFTVVRFNQTCSITGELRSGQCASSNRRSTFHLQVFIRCLGPSTSPPSLLARRCQRPNPLLVA